jgi:pantetheine-phosphate adenylyltransferase
MFDKLIVAIGVNSQKKYLFDLDKRIEWLEAVFADDDRIEVSHYKGLTVRFCKEVESKFIVRGLRNSSDFEYEKQISQLNNILGEGIETVFLVSQPKFSHISSSIVREILKNDGDASSLLPKQIVIK